MTIVINDSVMMIMMKLYHFLLYNFKSFLKYNNVINYTQVQLKQINNRIKLFQFFILLKFYFVT